MQVCPAVWLAQSLSHHGLSRPGPGSNTVVQHRHREPPAMKGPPNCTVITMRWCRSPHCLSRGQVRSVPSLCPTPGPPWQSRVAQMDMAPVGSALWATIGTTTVLSARCLAAGLDNLLKCQPASHPGLPIFTRWHLRKLGEIVFSSNQFDQEMYVDVCNWVQKYTFSEF